MALLHDEGDPGVADIWFSKVGSLVDARSQLISKQSMKLLSTTGTRHKGFIHDLYCESNSYLGEILSASGSGVMEGIVGTLGRLLGADRVASEPVLLTSGISESKAGQPPPLHQESKFHLYRLDGDA